MCNFHGPFKGLWRIKPWFIDCQVRSIWAWNRRSEIYEKLFNKQKTKSKSKWIVSEWERITTGIPQGSILEPLLSNIILNDLFLFISNSSISNYGNNNTLYTFEDNLKKIKDNLRNSFDTVDQWFYENYVVLNAEKCHFMCLDNNTENETFLFRNILIENSKEQKILCFIIDNKLNFKSNVSELGKRASQKIAALSRLSSYLHNSEYMGHGDGEGGGGRGALPFPLFC